MKRLKIAIIGSGWYGAHLAYKLSENHDITIIEKNSIIFSEASFKNQNRLHLGFHYPRSYDTRIQSKRGFKLFTKAYSKLLHKIDLNIYCISQNESLLDFRTYTDIMSSNGLEWEDITHCMPIVLDSIEGAVAVNELQIDAQKALEFFRNNLKCKIVNNRKITQENISEIEDSSDLVLDCTWNKLFPTEKYYYEPCIVFMYKKLLNINIAITIMDGNLFSIYPYEEDIYTLTHVSHTPLGQFKDWKEAEKRINCLNQKEINSKKISIESHVREYYKSFDIDYSYVGYFTSIKTKRTRVRNDPRFTYVEQIKQNTYSIHSGKIDTIFDIEHQILRIISQF